MQSKFLAVGSVVPWAVPHVGAVATQSYANPRYGPAGLALLRAGGSADEVVEQLTAADDERESRQLGVVDARGRGATFTGSGCFDWAGGRTGDGYAAQGNILVSGEPSTRWSTRSKLPPARPLAERLLHCLAAAQLAGGDRRGQQSAALLVVERDGGYGRLSDMLVDLRVDDHERPIDELRRLLRHPPSALRSHAARRVACHGRRRSARRSMSGYGERLEATAERSSPGRPSENLEELDRRRPSRSTRSCSRR